MLGFRLLKNHAGILLMGDYDSLRVAREIVTDVSERAVTVRDKEGWLMGLSYDIRKAYEMQREVIKPREHYEEEGPRYGVQILWPVILTQYAMLRTGLGFIDSNPMHQAVAFNLQAVIEEGLREDFGLVAEQIIFRWKHLDPAHADFENMVKAPCGLFCAMKKAERKKHLPILLAAMGPMYRANYEMFGDRDPDFFAYSPDEIAKWDGAEWPDPKW